MSESYIHGFTPEEQSRLTRMQEILNRAQLAQMELSGTRSILDVGAGLAQFSRDLVRAAGTDARVVAVERDPRQRAEAERQASEAGEADRLDLRAGLAEELPLAPHEWGTFDLAHARFLLEHVPDPAAVVRQMIAAVRPGGRVVLLDDDHELLRLFPECPEMDRVWRGYWESYRDTGKDPLVGRRMPELLHEAGAVGIEIRSVFYGAFHGGTLFDLVVDNLAGVLRGAAEGLDISGRVSRAEMGAAFAALDSWRRAETATLWYSLPLAEGRRPE